MALGEIVIGEATGEMIRSNSKQSKIGDKVIGMLGWQTHAVMDDASLISNQAILIL
jgi:NADPH-dependent curcumin reductase CurA